MRQTGQQSDLCEEGQGQGECMTIDMDDVK